MQFLMTAVVKIDVVADAGGGVAGAIEHAPGLVGGEFSFVPRRDAIDADDGYLVGYLTHCTTLQSYCVVRPPPLQCMCCMRACVRLTHPRTLSACLLAVPGTAAAAKGRRRSQQSAFVTRGMCESVTIRAACCVLLRAACCGSTCCVCACPVGPCCWPAVRGGVVALRESTATAAAAN